MESTLEEISQAIDSLALKAVMADAKDIPGLGEVLGVLESLQTLLSGKDSGWLEPLVKAMIDYVEKLILAEAEDFGPLEKAVAKLQEGCQRWHREQPLSDDIPALLAEVGLAETEQTAAPGSEAPPPPPETPPAGDLTAEDREIISDFVAESLENLGSVEITVMNLEQDPRDTESINAIFRAFHTIKGVSGFLNFDKINKLSHIVENLLDKARNSEIAVDEEIIDLILTSVDLLKQMVENVEKTLTADQVDEGDVDTNALAAKLQRYIDVAEGRGGERIGEILVGRGDVNADQLSAALARQSENKDQRIGEILVADQNVSSQAVVSALREQKRTQQSVSLQIKIDTGKLDNVVDMVGELAIAQSMLRQNDIVKNANDRKLDHIINQLNQITSGLQKTAMSLRMVPIKHSFQKMVRLVRDLAKRSAKEVDLAMFGEDTEIDRNMVEEIYEPMVHMIRNSVDHGLETPEEREAAGKPKRGRICLRAYHKGGDIIIEIEDNGRGLDKERILQKALEKGLVKEGEKLSEAEIHQLIFHPGFSTAAAVTEISGRGVGMDVVKSKIVERLRGRVDIQSARGEGTTISIRLPLTLAILDGMIVAVDGERFVIPTLAVQESFRPKASDYHTVQGQGEMLKVRDRLFPLIRMDQLIGVKAGGGGNGNEKALWDRLVVVVENQERKCCLLVDELLGQEEVVIKSLGESLKSVKGIAGGTIMGDGRISLIIDVAGIFEIVAES